jgi:NAD(P)-dependent dehydrogenase (short-subunit alcohol dehydrogenase family)
LAPVLGYRLCGRLRHLGYRPIWQKSGASNFKPVPKATSRLAELVDAALNEPREKRLPEVNMRELAGKTVFVTGGANGIGLALWRAFAEAGMQVMLADIEAGELDGAVKQLCGLGLAVRGVACDVADPASVEQAANSTFEQFGNVHVLCNNAGVAAPGGIEDIILENWRWVLDVNLMGVVHGIRAFLPHIRAHGEGGHIVNTASMAGMNSGLGFSPYSASKFAVVNISEGLATRLKPFGIGVTVLCPGFVRTRINDSGRNRPERYGPARVPDSASPAGLLRARVVELTKSGLDPADVAAQTISAIRDDELYVFTHSAPPWRAELEERFRSILTAIDRAAAVQRS